jgi:hypothetical protein
MQIKNPCKDIRKTRTLIGENQTVFWGRFGLTQTTGCRYEQGRRIPKPVKMLIEISIGADSEKVISSLRRNA